MLTCTSYILAFWWSSIIMKNPKFKWLHPSGMLDMAGGVVFQPSTLLHLFAPCMTATPLNFTAKVLRLLFAFLQLLKDAADDLRPQATQVQLQTFHKCMEIQLLTWSGSPWTMAQIYPKCYEFGGMKHHEPLCWCGSKGPNTRTSELPAHTSGSTDGLTPDFKTT